MVKITALSKFGFKLEGSNDWIKCDKSLINSPMFKSLVKFMDVELTQEDFNRKGFLISFDIPQHRKEVGSVSSSAVLTDPNTLNNSLPTSLNIKATDRQREILKGQCLNISLKDVDLSEDLFIDKGLSNAKKLFNKVEDSGFYNW